MNAINDPGANVHYKKNAHVMCDFYNYFLVLYQFIYQYIYNNL